MAVPVGRGLEIGLADDRLNSLDGCAGVIQHRREVVPEHVRGRAVHVDHTVDALHPAACDRHGDGRRPLADDELPLPEGLEIAQKVWDIATGKTV